MIMAEAEGVAEGVDVEDRVATTDLMGSLLCQGHELSHVLLLRYSSCYC